MSFNVQLLNLLKNDLRFNVSNSDKTLNEVFHGGVS